MRVFISFSSDNEPKAREIHDSLINFGHEVFAIIDTKISYSFRDTVKDHLTNSDALILLWSKSSLDNLNIYSEIGYFTGIGSDRLLIPISLDGSRPPTPVSDRMYLDATLRSSQEILNLVEASLSQYEASKREKEEIAAKRKEVVEESAEKYVEQSIDSLGKRERRYLYSSIGCYMIGYLAIVAGLIMVVLRLSLYENILSTIPEALYTIVLTLTAIGFLVAAAKYAFILGKAYMVEALRNHDRIHAIKFGEFYLKAYGTDTKWDELKEAFQHWNLDTGSTFREQDEKNIDPQILGIIQSLIEGVKDKPR